MSVDLRGFADEIHLRHDAMDLEREAVKKIFDTLREQLRDDKIPAKERQQLVSDFKELVKAERQFGPELEGYSDKSGRVLELHARLSKPPAPNKRTTDAPKTNAGPSSDSLAHAREGNVISLDDGQSPATRRRPIPPARHDPLVTPSAPAPDTAPKSQSVASDLVLTTAPSGAGEAATTSALAVASSFLCTACGAEREEAETLCWSCRAADLPEYRVSDLELLATPSVAHDRPLNRKDDGDAATKGSAVAASANSSSAMGTGPTNDDDPFNRIPDVLDRNRVTA